MPMASVGGKAPRVFERRHAGQVFACQLGESSLRVEASCFAPRRNFRPAERLEFMTGGDGFGRRDPLTEADEPATGAETTPNRAPRGGTRHLVHLQRLKVASRANQPKFPEPTHPA